MIKNNHSNKFNTFNKLKFKYGVSMSFDYYEDDFINLDVNKIYNLLTKGESEGRVLYIIRNAVDVNICQKIENNFYEIMSNKGNHRPDDGFVKTEQIGSSQFHKTGEEYIESTLQSNMDVFNLYTGISSDTVRSLYLDEKLEDFFIKKGIIYRASVYKGNSANFATTRRWLDNGNMSLWPHDDSAQLRFAEKDKYEIHKIKNVISSNLCICDASSGGELKVWNCKPDDKIRNEFGILDTGYPYPLEFSEKFENFTVHLAPGDLYFLNASYLHGVTSSVANERISSGRFLGYFNNKIVYWT